jgi:hypothetical protein
MRRRQEAAWLVLASALMSAGGCLGPIPLPVDINDPINPLSKVYVSNVADLDYHVRMNWPDGFIQVYLVESGTTQGLTGAIGTSGFPATIDVLTVDCDRVASLAGLPPGSAGIVVISRDTGVRLHELSRADATWHMAGSLETCGATPRN